MSGAATKRKRVDTGDEDCVPADKKPTATSSSSTAKPVAKKAVAKTDKGSEQSRWPWIDRCKPDMEFKGTKITMYNCGGTVFKATGKTLENRLDKLEKFLEECNGDETRHPSYGRY